MIKVILLFYDIIILYFITLNILYNDLHLRITNFTNISSTLFPS